MEKQKAGRKPLGAKPLTSAQKMRRQRARQAFLADAAQDSDFTPMTVLLSNKQLLAFRELNAELPDTLDVDTLSILLFKAAQFYLEREEFQLETTRREDWPKDHWAISTIMLNAKLKFNEWEKGLIQ
jgi:hypothetical protein